MCIGLNSVFIFYRNERFEFVASTSAYVHDRQRWLYPNKFTEIVVLVPNENQNFYHKMSVFSPTSIHVWMTLPLAMAIVCCCCQRVLNQPFGLYNFSAIATDNFGVMLGTTKGLPLHTRTERVLRLTMSLSALVLSMTIMSSIVSKYYDIMVPIAPTINTLADLVFKSNLNLAYMPEDKNWINGTKLQKLFQNRTNRLREVPFMEFYSEIANPNGSSAYIVERPLADVYLSPLWADKTLGSVYRVLGEKLGLLIMIYYVRTVNSGLINCHRNSIGIFFSMDSQCIRGGH